MYTPRGNVPPRESVNADTNVHPYMCHDNGIFLIRRRIGDIPLMGFSLLRGSRRAFLDGISLGVAKWSGQVDPT